MQSPRLHCNIDTLFKAWPLHILLEGGNHCLYKGRVIYYQLGGGRLYSGGSEIFLVMYWGVGENKMTHGQGGRSCILSGGSDVFHWSFFSLKVIASGGAAPRPPYILSQLYNVRLSEPLSDIGNKICRILVKQKSFSSNVALCFKCFQ